MLEQIPQFIKGFIIGLPVWGILGWFLKGLFSPTVDAWGEQIKKNIGANSDFNEYQPYIIFSDLKNRLDAIYDDLYHFSMFSEQKPYKTDKDINLILKECKKSEFKEVVKIFIENIHIFSYKQADIFFAALELLLNYLSKDNLVVAFNKLKENDQAPSLWTFLELVEKEKSELLTTDMLSYLRLSQKEWEDKQKKYE